MTQGLLDFRPAKLPRGKMGLVFRALEAATRDAPLNPLRDLDRYQHGLTPDRYLRMARTHTYFAGRRVCTREVPSGSRPYKLWWIE